MKTTRRLDNGALSLLTGPFCPDSRILPEGYFRAKIRFGIRENEKYLDGIGERDSPKFGHGMQDFLPVSVGNSGNLPLRFFRFFPSTSSN